MNKRLILEVALSQFNADSKGMTYEVWRELWQPFNHAIVQMSGRERAEGTIAAVEKIESFTVCENYILLNFEDGSVMKLDENDVEWIKNTEQSKKYRHPLGDSDAGILDETNAECVKGCPK